MFIVNWLYKIWFGCVLGPAVKYSDSNTILRYPPPTLGEHTTEVLQNILKYDEEKIKLLQSIKVIQ